MAIIGQGRGWDWLLLLIDEVGVGYYCSWTRLGLVFIGQGRAWVGLGWATTDLDFTRPPPHSINIPEVVSIVNIGTVFNV